MLAKEDVISSYAVHSKVECSLKCLQTSPCFGYNYRSKSNKYAVNCQLSKKTQDKGKYRTGAKGEWTFYQDLQMVRNID